MTDRFTWADGDIELLDPVDVVEKHGDHDQSDHGNWARGESTPGATATGKSAAKRHFNSLTPSYSVRNGAVDGAAARLLAEDGTLRERWDEARSAHVAAYAEAGAFEPSTTEQVGDVVSAWQSTSGDSDAHALSIQMAAGREFRIDDDDGVLRNTQYEDIRQMARSYYDGTVQPDLPAYVPNNTGDTTRVILRAMHQQTQAALAKDGVTEVTLYRGLRQPERDYSVDPDAGRYVNQVQGDAWDGLVKTTGSIAEVRGSPLSSWTSDQKVAASFARGGGLMLTATFPASRILSTARTGVGTLNEKEWVVLDGGGYVKIDRVREYGLADDPAEGDGE